MVRGGHIGAALVGTIRSRRGEDPYGARMAYWLKGAGTSASPLADDWPSTSLLWRTANFPRRPSIRAGDRIVYWAIGSGRLFEDREPRFFAIANVLSDPGQCAHPRWPWKVDVDFLAAVSALRDAPPLSEIDARAHRSPHVRLTDAQGRRAEQRLPALPPERAPRTSSNPTCRQTAAVADPDRRGAVSLLVQRDSGRSLRFPFCPTIAYAMSRELTSPGVHRSPAP
jgi:hypothetical protein